MDLLVNLDVDDLEKAIRFYSSAFALKVGRRFGAVGVEMLGSTAPIYLLVKSAGTPAADTGRRRILILSSMKSNRRLSERHLPARA
jgi:catechol 2,3-dioxygenase-like lactoylglutathione lyase family enzyme